MATPKDKEQFLATARRRFAQAEAEEQEIRREAETDLAFVAGKQWDEKVLRERSIPGRERPALTFNRLPTFVQQVANESRQNRPSIKFSPVDNAGDEDTAKVFEGLARHIQNASKAQIAYDTAIEYSASCGFGYFRLLTDYCHGYRSMDQEIKFAAVQDPFTVYGIVIPKIFGRKPQFAFVVENVPREEFEALYPDSEITAGWSGDGGWATRDTVRVAEYWHIEKKRRKVAYLEDGSAVEAGQEPEGARVMGTRVVVEDIVHSCKMTGAEVLPDTETQWAGDCIPVFAALGRSLVLKGEPHLFSLIRFQRDPQRLINYYKTGIAERIGLLNRAPYVGYKGQFKDPKWLSANTVNFPYLEVEPVTINGEAAPLPQRQNMEGQIMDLSQAVAQEIDDLKAISGIFDASLGQQGNETSGIAIARRQMQSNVTNLHFVDNLNRAQEEAGKALAHLIPRVYDTPRMIRIVGEDEEERVVRVNEPYQDPETGEMKTFMLEADAFDVTVTIGKAYTTKRQEASEMYGQVIQAAPQLLQVVGDVFFRNQDLAGSDEAAERMKKWINLTMPGLIEEENKKQDIPPQVQAQLQQMGGMIEQLSEALEQTSEEMRVKRLELESRERIALTQEETKRIVAMSQLEAQEGLELLRQEVASIKHQIDLTHASEMAEASRAHELERGAAQSEDAARMKAMDQEHQMGMQRAGQVHEFDLADAQTQRDSAALEQEQGFSDLAA